jgi:hypothetical protein
MPKVSMPKVKTGSKAGTKAGNTSAAICDGCCSAIVDDEHEAIQCEGTCQKWHHRLCAGVSKFHYDELADSPKPFICWLCSDSLHRAMIQNLQQEIAPLKASISADVESSHAEIAALKKDNAALKTALDHKLSQLQPSNSGAQYGDSHATKATKSYASVARQDQSNDPRPGRNQPPRRQRQNQNRNRQQLSGNVMPSSCEAEVNATGSGSSTFGPREVVRGARRVWGTLRSATCSSVKNSIIHLSKSNDSDIHVKRKFNHSTRSGKSEWWFILRGSEEILQTLENNWEAVKLQTGWQLEYCTKPIVNPSPTDPHPQLLLPDHNNLQFLQIIRVQLSQFPTALAAVF